MKLSAINTVDGARTPRIIKGVVVTGDVFVASPKKCQELRNSLGADAVEMEGAAVAQICYQRGVPFVVIRSISDSADEGAMVDKQMFYIMAAENSARLVREIVEGMDTERSMLRPVKIADKEDPAINPPRLRRVNPPHGWRVNCGGQAAGLNTRSRDRHGSM